MIDTISAETEGTTLVAGGEAGYLVDLGRLRAGPVAGAQYARVRMDGYGEAGDPVLTLNVSGQRASELVGFAGLETGFKTEVSGLSIAPFFKLLAEKQLDSSGGTIRYANTGSPTIVNRFELEEAEDDVYARLEGAPRWSSHPASLSSSRPARRWSIRSRTSFPASSASSWVFRA